MCCTFRICLLSAAFLLPMLAQAQTAITVDGDIPKTLSLTKAAIAAMPHVQVQAMDKSGKAHNFTGVSMAGILKEAGALGQEHHRDNLTKYVVVHSADDYAVLYSVTELDPGFSGRTIILADAMDGRPLAEEKGPYRIIVPGEDKKQARWIWSVTRITIKIAQD